MLLTSRVKKTLFSVALEQTVDEAGGESYSVRNESRVLVKCCESHATTDSMTFLGDESIVMKSGSKVFVQRDEDENVLGIVVAPPNGKVKWPSDLSTFRTGAPRSLTANCVMKLE